MTYLFPDDSEIPDHMARVQQRWDRLRASTALAARAEAIQAQVDHQAVERLLTAATKASKASQRVAWLHRAADVLASAVASTGAMACRRGCSHCCHIPVLITRAEAALMAEASNRTMSPVPRNSMVLAEQLELQEGREEGEDPNSDRWIHHVGVACPFLDESDHSCTVWSVRPLACRYYYTLDEDALLCRLVKSETPVEVPWLNTQARRAVSLAIQGLQQEAADIRDWFPADPLESNAHRGQSADSIGASRRPEPALPRS